MTTLTFFLGTPALPPMVKVVLPGPRETLTVRAACWPARVDPEGEKRAGAIIRPVPAPSTAPIRAFCVLLFLFCFLLLPNGGTAAPTPAPMAAGMPSPRASLPAICAADMAKL